MGARTRQDKAQTAWREAALLPMLIAITALVSIVSSLGAPLIPSIAHADHVSLGTAQWLLTAALVTAAVTTPVLGRLADGPSQRSVVVVALSLTLTGCVLAAISRDFTSVVIGRGLQGVGLGLLPVTMAVARRHMPAHQIGRGVATLAITGAICAGLGYPLTGLVAQVFDFHVAFWFGAAAVACVLGCGLMVLPGRTEVPVRRFDWIGAGALGLGVVGISVVLSEGGIWGWLSKATVFTVVGSVVVFVAWIRHELRAEDPLVDLSQVRHRSVLTANVSAFMICVAMYLITPVAVEFVQLPKSIGYGFDASIAISGLVLVPLSVGTFVASRFLVSFERRFGTRAIIPCGATLMALGALFFAVRHEALWEAFVAIGLVGLGVGFSFAVMPGLVVRAVPEKETGSALGFLQVLRTVGLSVGSALAATVLTAYTHPGAAYPTVGGFSTALLLAAGFCLGAAVISYLLPGRGPAVVEADPQLAREEAELGAAAVLLVNDPEIPASQARLERGSMGRTPAPLPARDR